MPRLTRATANFGSRARAFSKYFCASAPFCWLRKATPSVLRRRASAEAVGRLAGGFCVAFECRAEKQPNPARRSMPERASRKARGTGILRGINENSFWMRDKAGEMPSLHIIDCLDYQASRQPFL